MVKHMKMNFITVCTDTYPMIYAEKITRRLVELSNINFDCYCLTDRPDEVGDWATPLPLTIKAGGWWNKLNLFSPNMPEGWNLYLDIDILLKTNFDNELRWAVQNTQQIACISDAINWLDNKFSSSLMIFKTGALDDLYYDFQSAHKDLDGFVGGDQVWMGPRLKSVTYIDEEFPFLKHNLKHDLSDKTDPGYIKLPKIIPSKVKMIDCGGDPRVEDLCVLPYVKKYWEQIEPKGKNHGFIAC